MGVIGGVLIFLGGVVTGAGLLTLHYRAVAQAVTKVRNSKNIEIRRLTELNARLRSDNDTIQTSRDCSDAYRRGRRDAAVLSPAEQFARTFENRRNATFVMTEKTENN